MTCSSMYAIPIAWCDVDSIVKQLIAKKKGIGDWQEGVQLCHRLREDLHFDEQGLRALTPDLNDCFSSLSLQLTPAMVQQCETVQDLSARIREKIHDRFKQGTQ